MCVNSTSTGSGSTDYKRAKMKTASSSQWGEVSVRGKKGSLWGLAKQERKQKIHLGKAWWEPRLKIKVIRNKILKNNLTKVTSLKRWVLKVPEEDLLSSRQVHLCNLSI